MQGKIEGIIIKKKLVTRRLFRANNYILLFNPVKGCPFQARYQGPYEVIRKSGANDCVFSIPGRRKKTKMIHISLLKKSEGDVVVMVVIVTDTEEMPEQTKGSVQEDFSFDNADV